MHYFQSGLIVSELCRYLFIPQTVILKKKLKEMKKKTHIEIKKLSALVFGFFLLPCKWIFLLLRDSYH